MSEPQSMMLGVPAGAEPVSERSLEEKPPVPEKPKRKRTVSGRIIATIDNEIYKVEMSEAGVTVRRSCKHHVDGKPMREVVDFVTGQGRLELEAVRADNGNPSSLVDELKSRADYFAGFEGDLKAIVETMNRLDYPHHPEYPDDSEIIHRLCEMAGNRNALLESCIEFIACQMAESNNPGKHTGRYRLADSALKEQVETLAEGKIDEVFKTL